MSDEFTYTTCWKCRERWALRKELIEISKRSGLSLYCPFGHPGVWKAGKTDQELLQEELEAERQRRQSAEQNVEFYSQLQKRAEASARGYKGVATKLKNRARAGVCPCCKRTFKQLAAHMANKHPEFSVNPDGDLSADTPPILSVVEGGRA
jgi:hypothetical protein